MSGMPAEPPVIAVDEPPTRTALRVLGLVGLVYAIVTATHPGGNGRHLAALLLTVAVAVAWTCWLVARHRRLRSVSLGCAGALALSGGALTALHPIGIGVVAVAGLCASSVLDLAPATAVTGLGIVAAAIGVAVTGHSPAVIGSAASGAAAGLALGFARRQQEVLTQHAAQLAVAQQHTELEHERAEVLAERNRIAREVHDVLAHTLGALSVQMEALDSLLDDDAGATAVRESVQRSRRLVVEGLDETRRAVRVLRDEPVAVAEQIAALAHADDAAFVVHGEARPLPPALGLALVRVAQESLTNARKHAAGAPAAVTLGFADRSVTLTVDNAEPSAPSPLASSGGGYGLRGMRERVELLGGELSAGPHDGGWRVHVDVPA